MLTTLGNHRALTVLLACKIVGGHSESQWDATDSAVVDSLNLNYLLCHHSSYRIPTTTEGSPMTDLEETFLIFYWLKALAPTSMSFGFQASMPRHPLSLFAPKRASGAH